MRVKDLLEFENRMRLAHGWKRKEFCDALGISQPKLRRHVEEPMDAEIKDKTLALACAAVAAGLKPYGDE